MAQDNNGKLLWFLAGSAIGATIALLYAPQTGRETRRIIKRRTREGREALLDGVPYRQFWGEPPVTVAPRIDTVRYPLLRPEDEDEVEVRDAIRPAIQQFVVRV